MYFIELRERGGKTSGWQGPRPEQSLGLEMKAGEPWDLTSGPAGGEGQVALHLPPRMEPPPCCSVAQSSLTLCDPMDCSTPGSPVLHHLLELAQTLSIELVMPSSHLILCRPLLLLPSVFPSIRGFSNESTLCTRWPNYWSFSFSISPSNEYSGLISFRMAWFDLLAIQGTLKSLPQRRVQLNGTGS